MNRFYECGICGYLHAWEWEGACQDDVNRLTQVDMDTTPTIEVFSWEDRARADKYGDHVLSR